MYLQDEYQYRVFMQWQASRVAVGSRRVQNFPPNDCTSLHGFQRQKREVILALGVWLIGGLISMIDGGALRGLMSRSIEVLQPEKVIRNYMVGHQIGTAGHLMAAIGPGMSLVLQSWWFSYIWTCV